MLTELTNKNIKGLSIKQPYTDLVVFHNKIETRTWYTHYRENVLIVSQLNQHSWKSVEFLSSSQLKNIVGKLNWLSGDIKCGVALAIAELHECRPMLKSDEERCFINYDRNLFCHVFKKVIPIVPFEIVGSSHQYFDLTNHIINKITPL